MILFLRGTDLFMHHELGRSMFRDRKSQFIDRLGWELYFDRQGQERDEYDLCNPHYIIVADKWGRHAASLRLLPSNGPTMVNDHFLRALGGKPISDDCIWECTRLCQGESGDRKSVPKLLAATGFYMKRMGVTQLVGVFTGNMLRQYALAGAVPRVIGATAADGEEVFVGLWDFQDKTFQDLKVRSKVSSDELEVSLANAPSFELDRKMAG